jgi:hypothetical protein
MDGSAGSQGEERLVRVAGGRVTSAMRTSAPARRAQPAGLGPVVRAAERPDAIAASRSPDRLRRASSHHRGRGGAHAGGGAGSPATSSNATGWSKV